MKIDLSDLNDIYMSIQARKVPNVVYPARLLKAEVQYSKLGEPDVIGMTFVADTCHPSNLLGSPLGTPRSRASRTRRNNIPDLVFGSSSRNTISDKGISGVKFALTKFLISRLSLFEGVNPFFILINALKEGFSVLGLTEIATASATA